MLPLKTVSFLGGVDWTFFISVSPVPSLGPGTIIFVDQWIFLNNNFWHLYSYFWEPLEGVWPLVCPSAVEDYCFPCIHSLFTTFYQSWILADPSTPRKTDFSLWLYGSCVWLSLANQQCPPPWACWLVQGGCVTLADPVRVNLMSMAGKSGHRSRFSWALDSWTHFFPVWEAVLRTQVRELQRNWAATLKTQWYFQFLKQPTWEIHLNAALFWCTNQ